MKTVLRSYIPPWKYPCVIYVRCHEAKDLSGSTTMRGRWKDELCAVASGQGPGLPVPLTLIFGSTQKRRSAQPCVFV